jgi:hypothetical protein
MYEMYAQKIMQKKNWMNLYMHTPAVLEQI